MKEIDKNSKSFEDIKHVDENGVEFWYARELMPILQYSKWQNFKKTINKAMIACENSEIPTNYCFTDVSKPIISGKIVRKAIKEAGRNYARRFAYTSKEFKAIGKRKK